ncbi:aldo/keto reductase [Synechococcus sp. WH 8016]|uniref:aldo/keto reductase n=1 Tax=Synechococcus sp. WH 8016 TaxID=166318 RepID=UPI00022D8B55|nr:aldo/keto reductase [Synechococcus sp. WH 8016]EHA62965.1 Aldehyde reductase [Synechococcus sp. WH 8016]
MQYASLSNGDQMPLLGLGTWKSESRQVYAAVREAIKIGYRHIDCASVYGNEKEVGDAIRDAIQNHEVTRSELWITSKLWSNCHGKDRVEAALNQSIQNLGVDYLNLYLIHWPVSIKPEKPFAESVDDLLSPEQSPIGETWEAMESACEKGLTRHIGVSNFSIQKLQKLISSCKQKPEVNQVEHHPLLQQQALLEYCASEGILITAYSPLGSMDRPEAFKVKDAPVVLENPVIRSIAETRGCSPAQVVLAWDVQRGISAIPKSVKPSRLLENLQAAEIKLSTSELQTMEALDQNIRLVNGSFWVMEGGPWTLQSLWDTP